ncbi:MAG: PIN domain-containing protein [Candidatus Sumerlaeia bacterium]|nr:PIN domain-containing protein [Candidatus Sumerlaeia bacterium]
MPRLLIDTNVVSYFHRQDSRAKLYEKVLEDSQLLLSWMSLAEIRYGYRVKNWGLTRVLDIETYLQANFLTLYPTDNTVTIFAECLSISRKLGRPMSHGDAWIAATAMEWEVPLVTHNAKDYEVLGERIQLLSSDADESNSGE